MNTELNQPIVAKKPSVPRIILNIIVTYIAYNLVLNVVYILLEYKFYFLSNIPILGLLVDWDNFSGIIIAPLISVVCVEIINEIILHNIKYEKLSKFVMGIIMIVISCFNLLCVLCGATYYPQYALLLISGIVYVVKNKDYKTYKDWDADDISNDSLPESKAQFMGFEKAEPSLTINQNYTEKHENSIPINNDVFNKEQAATANYEMPEISHADYNLSSNSSSNITYCPKCGRLLDSDKQLMECNKQHSRISKLIIKPYFIIITVLAIALIISGCKYYSLKQQYQALENNTPNYKRAYLQSNKVLNDMNIAFVFEHGYFWHNLTCEKILENPDSELFYDTIDDLKEDGYEKCPLCWKKR